MVVLKNADYEMQINELGATIEGLYYQGMKIAVRGITIGRYANRIAKGRFVLNGKEYILNCNDGRNQLHGGPTGFATRVWKVEHQEDEMAVLSIFSPDGDENYPGNFYLEVEFRLLSDGFSIEYTAKCDADTVCNFTNHAYYNLNGALDEKVSQSLSEDEKKMLGMHELWLNADMMTDVDSELIPTGTISEVSGIYDFRNLRVYDHNLDNNFCIKDYNPEKIEMHKAAKLVGKKSGLTIEVFTDQPGIQIYNTDTEICLESQHFPDSPNQPDFPTTVLKGGEIFTTKTVYKITK